ncbi:MAG: phosphoadenosine phosphosulfate reductase family protein [Porticoccaceae bacterium]|jgi:phosphoadenosine phosphosulfate reductase|nr:phosphoadenosine phosphosulfate reductase family protein [Porticoccaceae bacterium]MEA3299745.1 phosphoadenosine phosphosulfate reductase family protein [Pseudomonadota bacterium]HLS98890.1 phosphoadenosine phosphosulfate reductase family protein [Porticoccaceae bacterium]
MFQQSELQHLNAQLRDKTPQEIIQWALGLDRRVFASTSFSPNSAGLLHMVKQIAPDMPVVWVDSGYNLPDAYRTAEKIIAELQLDIRVYIPEMTAERRNALMGGIPHPDDDEALHREFTRQVKLEPFQRALNDLKGEIWITGIRQQETEFRKSLDILTLDDRGLLRVAPIFYWTEDQLQAYVDAYNLPSCRHYFDPTKVIDGRECGLHTSA